MTFAPWSVAYLIPFLIYAYYSITVRRTTMDPLLFGGGLLGVMFLLYDPDQGYLPASVLLLFHLLSSGAYWIGGLLAYRHAKTRLQRPPKTVLVTRQKVFVVLALTTVLLGLFVFLFSYEGSSQLLLSMRHRPGDHLGSLMAETSNLERLSQYLRCYLAPSAVFTLFLWWRLRQRSPIHSLWMIAVLLLCIVLQAASGSRGAILFFGLHCIFATHYALRGRAGARALAKVLAVSFMPALVAIVLLQTLYRDTGFSMAQTKGQLDQRGSEAISAVLVHGSFNDDVQFILTNYPVPYRYTWGYSLMTPLLAFVPRSVWEGKPIPWGRTLALQHGFAYDTTVSLAATVAGEGYANFGVVGWALFPFGIGFAAGWTFAFLRHGRNDFETLIGLSSLCWTLSLRGDVHSAASSIVFPFLAFIVVIRVLAFRKLRYSQPTLDTAALEEWSRSSPGLCVPIGLYARWREFQTLVRF